MASERSVLLLSDDRAMCRTLKPLLSGSGFSVEVQAPGRSPLRQIRDASSTLALLDINVDTVGLELLRRLEGGRAWGDTPLIVISEQADLEFELLDIFDFLAKPIDRDRLRKDLELVIEHRPSGTSGPYPPISPKELGTFQDLINQSSGLYFDDRNQKILERGLMRRMRAVRAHSYSHYLNYLHRHAESRGELKKLLALLTVGETYFFRYLAQFEALKSTIIPELIERNTKTRHLRLWSAGCSTGEEPYSLAILLHEHFPQLADWCIDIIGTDINHRSLKKARSGSYNARALRVMEPAQIKRYFLPEGSGYRLRPEIASRVQFAHLNLQTDTYPSSDHGTDNVDLIFCRNVMIYFSLPTVRQILKRFHDCLSEARYLFLGHSESLASITNAFDRVSCEGGFFYRRAESRRTQTQPRAPSSASPSQPPILPQRGRPSTVAPRPTARVERPEPKTPTTINLEETLNAAKDAFRREDFQTASQKYDIVLRQDPAHIEALLGKGFIAANNAEYDLALDYCRRVLTADDLTVPAYYLQGLVLELREDLVAAIQEYRKAILLEMDFVMPHFNLSKIYQRLGRNKDARRELLNTRRLLEQLPAEVLVPHSGGLSREVFLEVCREDLELTGSEP